MEVVKYAQAFRALFPKVPVHLISGHINEMGQGMLGDQYHIHTIQGLDGFDPWPLYEDLFIQKLERGGPVYNG